MSQLIMIIDDEAGMRDLLGDALKLAGFETVTAADAMIAQTLLRTTKPDLLIVDINMPLMYMLRILYFFPLAVTVTEDILP
jgi:two-component system OmpR family response regulator